MKFACHVLVLCLAVAGCSNTMKYHPSDKQQLANEIRKIASRAIMREMDLSPYGTGGQMMKDIEMLALSFQHPNVSSIAQARKMLVEVYCSPLRECSFFRSRLDYLT